MFLFNLVSAASKIFALNDLQDEETCSASVASSRDLSSTFVQEQKTYSDNLDHESSMVCQNESSETQFVSELGA